MLHRVTHMLSCQEVSRLLSQGQDRSLSWRERVKLQLHLRVCTACTRFARQLAAMREAMERYRT